MDGYCSESSSESWDDNPRRPLWLTTSENDCLYVARDWEEDDDDDAAACQSTSMELDGTGVCTRGSASSEAAGAGLSMLRRVADVSRLTAMMQAIDLLTPLSTPPHAPAPGHAPAPASLSAAPEPLCNDRSARFNAMPGIGALQALVERNCGPDGNPQLHALALLGQSVSS
eukprot:NODE_4410_length_812_cov_27.993447_g4077_i0.p1 GENE.NODE_4410_length_812_cov_27.993447_g4077_i0~~NODE_4410_length_812_cov_27.993447_g4077_i0.p1  ORF type:complete len:171 (-),score=22.24 NODE_4410_length_812_cov_27.993447_g4077_i0:188-700(-)